MTEYKPTKTMIVSNKIHFYLVTILVDSSRADRLISGVLLHCRLVQPPKDWKSEVQELWL
jgi:hypothetical protein